MAGSVVVGLFSIFIFYLGVGGRWNLRGEGRGRCREKEGGLACLLEGERERARVRKKGRVEESEKGGEKNRERREEERNQK